MTPRPAWEKDAMPLETGDYFLSATNPVANVDQRDLERLAMRLFERPDVKAARARAGIMWRRGGGRLIAGDQIAAFADHRSDHCF